MRRRGLQRIQLHAPWELRRMPAVLPVRTMFGGGVLGTTTVSPVRNRIPQGVCPTGYQGEEKANAGEGGPEEDRDHSRGIQPGGQYLQKFCGE